MMTRLFPLLLLLACASCFNYETQFEGPYEEVEETTVDPPALPKEVVYVAGGKVYLANKFVEDSIIIDNSGDVTIASVNNNHTKVIFRRSSGNIQIYDIESAKITGEVPDTKNAIWFDFHVNNETIYFLGSDDNLDTYGPEVLSNRPIDLLSHSNTLSFGRAKGVVVLEDGSFIYSMAFSGIFNTYFLFLSDGDDVQEFSEIPINRKSMRLNTAENLMWSGDEYDNFLHTNNVPSMDFRDQDSGFLMGTPIDFSSGYKVTQDNEIYTPQFKTIESPSGKITAIDY